MEITTWVWIAIGLPALLVAWLSYASWRRRRWERERSADWRPSSSLDGPIPVPAGENTAELERQHDQLRG